MTEQAPDQAPETKKRSALVSNFYTLVIAFLLAMGFRSFFFEPFHIPTGSMKNTLLVGDYLFVSKYSYGYSRYSFPLGLPLFEGRMAEFNQPKRGDVVVFRFPQNPHVDFIKRLIGLPGDKIQLREGIVYINDQPLPRTRLSDYADDENRNNIKSVPAFSETLPEGKIIHILKQYKIGIADDTQVYTVPPKHYFMMGDNRDNSHDSRFLEDVGYVDEANLVGRAEIIFFSTDGSAKLSDPASWFSAMRPDRFLKRIE